MNQNLAVNQIIGKREQQQDYLGQASLSDSLELYVLADGMGGHIGGALASKEVVHALIEWMQQQYLPLHEDESLQSSEPSLEQLSAAVEVANNHVTDILREQPELNGMGTTLLVLLFDNASGYYWFVSVGDSPIYLWNSEAGLQRINENHAYYEVLKKQVENKEITQEEADNHRYRHAVTSAIMGKTYEHIDKKQGVLSSNELMLMASDGVQTLNDEPNGELAALLASSNSLTQKVSQILQAVESKDVEYQDNTSLLLIQGTTKTVKSSGSYPQVGLDAKSKLEQLLKMPASKVSGQILGVLLSLIVIFVLVAIFCCSDLDNGVDNDSGQVRTVLPLPDLPAPLGESQP